MIYDLSECSDRRAEVPGAHPGPHAALTQMGECGLYRVEPRLGARDPDYPNHDGTPAGIRAAAVRGFAGGYVKIERTR